MKSISVSAGIVFLLAALGLFACGGDEGGSGEGPDASNTIQPGERRVIPTRTKTGEMVDVQVVGEGGLPEGFPADFPVYPKATSVGAIAVPGQPTVVRFETPAPVDDVHAFYKEQLSDNGWKITEEKRVRNSIQAEKDGLSVSVALFRTGSQTEIGVMLSGS